MKTATKFFLVSALVLSPVPVLAQTAQLGDYYAPVKTSAQQATPEELNELHQGDFYATAKAAVQQPNSQVLFDDAHGDFYAPAN